MTQTGSDPWETLEGKSTRTPRDLETREKSTRRAWSEPAILPEPEPQDGWAFRWVRVETRGQADKLNAQKSLNEGWEVVDAADHPEIAQGLGLSESNGTIERGGLILCKMPQEMVDQRVEYYLKRTNAEVEAADNQYMRNSDERMKKIVDRKRRTVFAQ